MGLKAKMMGGAGSYNLANESAAKKNQRYCWLAYNAWSYSCGCVER